jgi:hypothetical protein
MQGWKDNRARLENVQCKNGKLTVQEWKANSANGKANKARAGKL